MAGLFTYYFFFLLYQALIKIGWFRWRTIGTENLPPRVNGGMILAVNHISWLDIHAVGVLLPPRYRLTWLGKIELFRHPLANWFFRQMLVIPVKRGGRDLAAIREAEETLKRGAVMLIYPEGHRSGTGILQKGHGGAIRLAMQAGVPIVPMAIFGTRRGLRGSMQRDLVTLHIGKPYFIAPTPNGKISPALMETLTNEMMQRIAAMLPEANRGIYGQPEVAQEVLERIAGQA